MGVVASAVVGSCLLQKSTQLSSRCDMLSLTPLLPVVLCAHVLCPCRGLRDCVHGKHPGRPQLNTHVVGSWVFALTMSAVMGRP